MTEDEEQLDDNLEHVLNIRIFEYSNYSNNRSEVEYLNNFFGYSNIQNDNIFYIFPKNFNTVFGVVIQKDELKNVLMLSIE